MKSHFLYISPYIFNLKLKVHLYDYVFPQFIYKIPSPLKIYHIIHKKWDKKIYLGAFANL